MKKRLLVILLALFDMVLINMSILLAYLLHFESNAAGELGKAVSYLAVEAVAATIIKVTCFAGFKLYSSLWRYAGIYEVASIIKAAFIGNAVMFGYTFFFPAGIPGSIFAATFFIDIVLIGGARLAYRIIKRFIRKSLCETGNIKRVMIIGGGYAGAIVIKELIVKPELRRLPVVIVDDDNSKIGRKINGIPIAGNRKDIVRLVHDKLIDEIIITIPSANKRDIGEIFNECFRTRCKVKILPGVADLIDDTRVIQKIRDMSIDDLLGRESVDLDIGAIASYLADRVIMVTGGGGSIGSELCRQISAFSPRQLIILDNNENGAYDLQNELTAIYPQMNLFTVIANIRDVSRLEEIFGKYRPQVVFHAAAHKHVPLMEMHPTEAIKNNVVGTLNVVECSEKFGVERFILISTDKAVNPSSIMGATKRVAEMIVQAFSRCSSTVFAAVRFGNVLGSSGSIVPLFKKQIEQGGPVTVTDPEVARFFMTIPEAAQLVIEAGAAAKGGEIFVLDMGKPVKIYDLARTLIRLSGLEPETDIEIRFTGLRPGEKMHEELFFEAENLQPTRSGKIFMVVPGIVEKEKLVEDIAHLNHMAVTDPDAAAGCLHSLISRYKVAV